jgi:hypothetical protein
MCLGSPIVITHLLHRNQTQDDLTSKQNRYDFAIAFYRTTNLICVTVHKKFLGFHFFTRTCLMKLSQLRSFSAVSKKFTRPYIWTRGFRWRTRGQDYIYGSMELTHLAISQWLFRISAVLRYVLNRRRRCRWQIWQKMFLAFVLVRVLDI